MTLNEFSDIAAQRIPTPREFVEFAECQRWRFKVGDGRAALVARKDDPLALAFAKMLSREPYRTNVLKILAERGAQLDRTPEPNGEPDPEPESCRQCKRDVSDSENRDRLMGVNPFCRETPCPYRGSISPTPPSSSTTPPATETKPKKPTLWNGSSVPETVSDWLRRPY
jgi:hypothetical protein